MTFTKLFQRQRSAKSEGNQIIMTRRSSFYRYNVFYTVGQIRGDSHLRIMWFFQYRVHGNISGWDVGTGTLTTGGFGADCRESYGGWKCGVFPNRMYSRSVPVCLIHVYCFLVCFKSQLFWQYKRASIHLFFVWGENLI